MKFPVPLIKSTLDFLICALLLVHIAGWIAIKGIEAGKRQAFETFSNEGSSREHN